MRDGPLSPVQASVLLRAAADAIALEVRALPEAMLSFHPAPGEWCVKEVLGHLIEAERRGFAGRIRILLDTTDPALQTWDQNAVARERGDCAREASVLLDERRRLRQESVPFAASLPGPALGRAGVHPRVGRLTISDVMHEWVHHDRNHLRQMLENVRAFLWPALGNAQKFSME